MSKRIAVFTGTRADYGLLYWLMRDLQRASDFDLEIIASGTHLSPEFGNTATFIENDGFVIADSVEILLSSDTAVGIAKSIGLGTIGFADALRRISPDAVIILGDRFEALAIAQTALVMQIPIVHIHGGEITEGAYDDAIRHAISKMAKLHFASCEAHRRRLIQMGEEPHRVFNVGAVGLEHLTRTTFLNRDELSDSLKFDIRQKPFFLVTYHPETASDESPVESYQALIAALDHFPGYVKIITYPNADNGSRALIPLIEKYAQRNPDQVVLAPSLGQVRYLSAMRLAAAVIGNSSSGIIEAPSCHIPTVDIGERQRGRTRAESVISCGANTDDIITAIHFSLSPEHQKKLEHCVNPYGAGEVSGRIMTILRDFDLKAPKHFHDIEKEVR